MAPAFSLIVIALLAGCTATPSPTPSPKSSSLTGSSIIPTEFEPGQIIPDAWSNAALDAGYVLYQRETQDSIVLVPGEPLLESVLDDIEQRLARIGGDPATDDEAQVSIDADAESNERRTGELIRDVLNAGAHIVVIRSAWRWLPVEELTWIAYSDVSDDTIRMHLRALGGDTLDPKWMDADRDALTHRVNVWISQQDDASTWLVFVGEP